MLSGSSLPDPASCTTSAGFSISSLKCSLLMTIAHAPVQRAPNTPSLSLLPRRRAITHIQMFWPLLSTMFPRSVSFWGFFFFLCFGSAVDGLTREPAQPGFRNIFHYRGHKMSAVYPAAPGVYASTTWSGWRRPPLLMAHVLKSSSWPPAVDVHAVTAGFFLHEWNELFLK